MPRVELPPRRSLVLDLGLILIGIGLETAVSVSSQTRAFGHHVPLWTVSLVMFVAYLPIFWRRRFPRALLVWMSVIAASQLAVDYTPFFGLVVAMFGVGRYCRLRPAVLSGLLAIVPITFGAFAGSRADWTVGFYATYALLWALLLGGVWWAGRSLRLAESLRRRQRAMLLAAAQRRRQQERLALARELHDSVAGSISAMVLQAAGAKAVRQRDEARAEAALDVIVDTGTQAVREMQRLLGLLRSEDDSLDVIVTESASHENLPELVEAAERRGLQVALEVEGAPHAVSPSVSTAAYRVVQESLTNALKHAGTGSAVDIEVHWRQRDLELEVRSHSHQSELPDLPSTGYGLAGLGERIRLVGGTFSFRQERDAFVTTATLPLADGA